MSYRDSLYNENMVLRAELAERDARIMKLEKKTRSVRKPLRASQLVHRVWGWATSDTGFYISCTICLIGICVFIGLTTGRLLDSHLECHFKR